MVGGIVLTVVALGAVVAGILFVGQRSPTHAATDTAVTQGQSIAGVTVFMADNRTPDNPAETVNVIDGNTSTFWSTDPYTNANFGNLYPGIGLDIRLKSPGKLHKLEVSSPDVGWSAETYVSDAAVASGQSASAWGAPTDTRTATGQVTTFVLHGQAGSHVLLWLTNLGPARNWLKSPLRYEVRIQEVSVR
jgi:hypothetical protein